MIERTELIERWSHVDMVLDSMSEHDRQHHWDMSTWGRKTDCGTVACAAGQCGLNEWFRERGFKTVFPKGGTQARTPDVPNFFGIEGANRIFYNATQRAVETVIGEVRSYVAELQKLASLESIAGLPRIGEDWPEEGGAFAGAMLGLNGANDYYLIVGPEAEARMDWDAMVAWAPGLSVAGKNDFTLHGRSEGPALYDRVRSLFQPEAYWLREQHADCSSYAWGQSFTSGNQYYWDEGIKFRGRAVRRVSIQ